jgi:hypothetical protein
MYLGKQSQERFLAFFSCLARSFPPIIGATTPDQSNCVMSSSRDPFGFPAKPRPRSAKAIGGNPIVVVAQPGQEVRIVVPDDGSVGAGIQGRADSRQSPSGSGDSRASPSGSGDSRASPSGSGDAQAQNPFGFLPVQRGFSPTPITVIARSGQEIRIVVPDESGSIPGLTRRPSGDSRASPSGQGDQ